MVITEKKINIPNTDSILLVFAATMAIFLGLRLELEGDLLGEKYRGVKFGEGGGLGRRGDVNVKDFIKFWCLENISWY